MNILERRKLKTELYDIIKNLEIFETKLKLAGSASLRSMMYYSDYDFNCKIRVRKQTPIYNEFKRILSFSNDKLYFIEFKIEYIDGTKIKLHNVNDIKLSMFKNISFIKIDYIVFLDFIFKEEEIKTEVEPFTLYSQSYIYTYIYCIKIYTHKRELQRNQQMKRSKLKKF